MSDDTATPASVHVSDGAESGSIALLTTDSPTPATIRPSTPVVDPRPESGPDLIEIIRLVCIGMPDEEPDVIAAAVVSQVPPDAIESAYLQAVTYICRRFRVRTYVERPRPRPEPRYEPAPPREPEVGTARKIDAAAALRALPNHLNERVNVGSVKEPQWKQLGDCTAPELVDAIEVRRDIARVNVNAADFYAVLLDEMVERRAGCVRDLLAQRRSA